MDDASHILTVLVAPLLFALGVYGVGSLLVMPQELAGARYSAALGRVIRNCAAASVMAFGWTFGPFLGYADSLGGMIGLGLTVGVVLGWVVGLLTVRDAEPARMLLKLTNGCDQHGKGSSPVRQRDPG